MCGCVRVNERESERERREGKRGGGARVRGLDLGVLKSLLSINTHTLQACLLKHISNTPTTCPQHIPHSSTQVRTFATDNAKLDIGIAFAAGPVGKKDWRMKSRSFSGMFNCLCVVLERALRREESKFLPARCGTRECKIHDQEVSGSRHDLADPNLPADTHALILTSGSIE